MVMSLRLHGKAGLGCARELADDVVSHGSLLCHFCAAAAQFLLTGCFASLLLWALALLRESQSQSPKPAFGKRSKAFQS
jgi:hypothetical protein